MIRGSYGYTDANGLYRVVDYVADDDGFRGTQIFEFSLGSNIEYVSIYFFEHIHTN